VNKWIVELRLRCGDQGGECYEFDLLNFREDKSGKLDLLTCPNQGHLKFRDIGSLSRSAYK
jgi:hypothetical protein